MSEEETKPKLTITEKQKIKRRQNLEKARVIKREQQQKQRLVKEKIKQHEPNLSESDETESESEEEEVIYKPPKKESKNKIKYIDPNDEIVELRKRVSDLEKKKTRKKTVYLEKEKPVEVIKTVEKQVLQKDQMLDSMKNRILNF